MAKKRGKRTVFGGGGDEAGGRFLVGTSVGEVSDRVSFEEGRGTMTPVTGPRHQRTGRMILTGRLMMMIMMMVVCVGAELSGGTLLATARRFLSLYATAHVTSRTLPDCQH